MRNEIVFDENSAQLLWSLFATPTIRSLASARPSRALRQLKSVAAAVPALGSRRIASLLELAYMAMSRSELGEYFYKNALLQRHVFSKFGSKRARILFEFRAGRSKLDALVVRESLHAVEIKTELDHFRRLPTQIDDYRNRFAHVWVFASEKYASKLEVDVSLSRNVGIAFMNSRRAFSVIRDAVRDVNSLNSRAILECLQRTEYLEVLREHGFDGRGMPNTRLFSEAMRFAEKLDPELVHEAALGQLKGRMGSASPRALSSLPHFLRAAAVAAGCDDVALAYFRANLAKSLRSLEAA